MQISDNFLIFSSLKNQHSHFHEELITKQSQIQRQNNFIIILFKVDKLMADQEVANNPDQNQPVENDDPHHLSKVQRYKSFRSLFGMALVYSFGMFYCKYSTTYLGVFTEQELKDIFNIQIQISLARGLLTGVIFFGGGIGALLCILFLKIFSRRQSLIITFAIAFVTGLIVLIPNFPLLFICRLIQGICAGLLCTLCPVITKQILPIETSGVFGAFSGIFFVLGAWMCYMVNYIINQIIGSYEGYYQGYWRIVVSFTLPFLILQLVMLIFVFDYETPKYLLQNDRQEDCIKLLQEIYKPQFVYKVLKQKKIDLGLDVSSQSSDLNQKKLVQFNPQVPQNDNQNKDRSDNQINSANNIVSQNQMNNEKQEKSQNPNNEDDQDPPPRHKKCLRRFMAIDLIFMQQFTGEVAIVPFGALIGGLILPDLSNLLPVLYIGVSLLAGIFVSFLLSRFGRKPVYQIGTLAAIVSLVLITIGFFTADTDTHEIDVGKILVLTGLFSWMLAAGLSVSVITWVFVAQIVEPSFYNIPLVISWMLAVLIGLLFPILQDAITAGPIFAFFATYSGIFLIINQRLIIETKNRTQTDIYTQYDRKQTCF